MLKKKKKMLFYAFGALILISCTTPPNTTACVDLGPYGTCVEYLSKKKYRVDNLGSKYVVKWGKNKGKEMDWDQVKAGAVVLPSDQAGQMKTFFDDLCHKNKCPNNVGDWNTFFKELQGGN